MSDDLKSETPNLPQPDLQQRVLPQPVLLRRDLFHRLGLLGVGAAATLAGVMVEGAPAAQAQGYPPLPPPRYEPVPPPPGARFVWQPGHWRWNGYRYAWFPGRYIPAGPRYARFIPGHWALRYGQWVWIPQHWR